jgi:hypothetical protein
MVVSGPWYNIVIMRLQLIWWLLTNHSWQVYSKVKYMAGQWFTPAIPPTREAEITRIVVWGQFGQKKSSWDHISTNERKLDIVVHACHPSYAGSISRRIRVQARQGTHVRPHSKNQQSKKGWGHGSSGRAPAWQVQDPEFKLQVG